MTPDFKSPQDWVRVRTYPDMVAAELDAGFIEAEGVAVRLLSHSSLPGMPGKTDLLVESAAEHRAIWLLKIPPVSDGELEFLATGEFPKPEDKPGEKA